MTCKLLNQSSAIIRNAVNRQLMVLMPKQVEFVDSISVLIEDVVKLQTGCWGYGGGIFHYGADAQEGYLVASTLNPSATHFCRVCMCDNAADLDFDLSKHHRNKVTQKKYGTNNLNSILLFFTA